MAEPTPQFACLHAGPRGRQYGIPAALARAGMLQRFYTDFCVPHALGARLGLAVPQRYRPERLQNFFSRVLPPDVPWPRVRSFAAHRLVGGKGDQALSAFLRQQVLRDNFAGASGLYTTINGDLELAREAKARGLVVVHDQVLNPDVGHILRQERERFAGIEAQDPLDEVEAGIARDRAMWRLADRVLAPSPFARDAIINLGGEAEKTLLVPYGISPTWLAERPVPRRGRILFVGSVGLRKGIHYLAAATRLLRQRGVMCEVRVVGPYTPGVIARPEFQGPTYVGRVPRSRVRHEYLAADVFVHPSLSEGSAIAHLEAMACGLPVVATPNAGAVTWDGVDGFVVPPRDAEALAARLQELVANRALRRRMGQAAWERAHNFVWPAYARRLRYALDKLRPHQGGRAACT